MDEVKLLPCPDPWCEDQSPRWRLGASGRYRASCGCGIEAPWSDTQEKAIAAWNARPTLVTDELVERLTEVREAQNELIEWTCASRSNWRADAHAESAGERLEKAWAAIDASLAAAHPQPGPSQ